MRNSNVCLQATADDEDTPYESAQPSIAAASQLQTKSPQSDENQDDGFAMYEKYHGN